MTDLKPLIEDLNKILEEAQKPKKWIAAAIKKPGALKRSLKVAAGKKIPRKKLVKAAKKTTKTGKTTKIARRARLALTLRRLGK